MFVYKNENTLTNKGKGVLVCDKEEKENAAFAFLAIIGVALGAADLEHQ